MMAERNRRYKASDHVLLRPFSRNLVFSLSVHWVFQGMLYMDRTELLFKLGLDLVLGTVGWTLLWWLLGVSWFWALLASFLLAHTLNLLFNAQICVVLKDFGMMQHSWSDFCQYSDQLAQRIRAEPSIRYAAAFGSLTRGEWTEFSDLDVRIVRHPGFLNGLRACLFVLCERTRALVIGFPLDVFVLDDLEKLATMRDDEKPVELRASGDSA